MLVWEDNRFTIGNRSFQIMVELSDLFTMKNKDGLILGKPRRYIDKYCEHLSGRQFKNIFELGIFRGGSTIFLGEMFKPEKLVAIDFNEKSVGVLERYAQESGNQGRIYPFYGVDQSDEGRLSEIYKTVFGDEKLDLVVDDASHFLEETCVSFNFLFPRLRAGGIYIIEDWSWAHLEHYSKDFKDQFSGKLSMSNLVIDIVIASASVPGMFDEIVVNDGFVMVRKGEGMTDLEFDVHKYNLYRGRALGKRDYFS